MYRLQPCLTENQNGKIPDENEGHTPIIQVYAPNTADPEEKVDKFYEQLEIMIK